MPRYHCPIPLHIGNELDLPAGAARHVQVLRHQPGDTITLFEGQRQRPAASPTPSPTWAAAMRRARGGFTARRREAARAVHLRRGHARQRAHGLAGGKATELGVASISP
jgi:16S rRNA (uracil1498-N3)-methyltransferase